MANCQWIGGDGGGTGSWSVAANWSSGTVPVNGDSVYIDGRGTAGTIYDIDSGLNQSAVTVAFLQQSDDYTGNIGTLSARLQLGITKGRLGFPSGKSSATGCPRFRLDLGSVAASIEAYSTADNATENGSPPVRIVGSNASNRIDFYAGNYGIATEFAADTANFPTINLVGAGGGTPTVTLGIGCSVGTVNMLCGTFQSNDTDTSPTKTFTSFTLSGGTATVYGASPFTLLTIIQPTDSQYAQPVFVRRCIGVITKIIIGNNGTFDGSQDPRALTITDIDVYATAVINFVNGVGGSYTQTNGAVPKGCGVQDVTTRTMPGYGFKWA